MNAALDILGSFFVGGILLIIVLNLNADLMDRSFSGNLELITQQNAASIGELLDYDLRQIGYGVDDPDTAIIRAGTDRIIFWTDIDDDGNVDSLRYYMASTPTDTTISDRNADTYILYRLAGSESENDVDLGVTSFNLTYYDSDGNTTTDKAEIKIIEVEMTVQSLYEYDGDYATAYYYLKIAPKNL